jgi:hypothetical protein
LTATLPSITCRKIQELVFATNLQQILIQEPVFATNVKNTGTGFCNKFATNVKNTGTDFCNKLQQMLKIQEPVFATNLQQMLIRFPSIFCHKLSTAENPSFYIAAQLAVHFLLNIFNFPNISKIILGIHFFTRILQHRLLVF